MKKILFIALLSMANLISKAQVNLVPNPSFEQYDTCPNIAGEISFAIPWTNPIYASSPDYFNACNSINFHVPNNYAGNENARTGVAYAGIITDYYDLSNPPFSDSREYLQVKLLSELVAGAKYCIIFYVSASDSMRYISNDIGVYFSTVEINYPISFFGHPLPFLPQFENTNNLSSRNGWTEVTGEFTASGGEKYIIIGNFKDHISTTSFYTGWSPNFNIHNFVYYYIDDVAIYKCDSNSILSMPNIFTPNNDGLNDFFIPLEKLDFKSGLLKIFNRWGNEIFNTDNIYSGWDGGNSSNGVYYWELKYTDLEELDHRILGYVVLIR